MCNWHVSAWGACSAQCGQGLRTRDVWCSSGDASQCDASQKPATQTMCDSSDACSFKLGNWTACLSADGAAGVCGEGLRVRSVTCEGDSETLSRTQRITFNPGSVGTQYVLGTGARVTSQTVTTATRAALISRLAAADGYEGLPYTVADVNGKVVVRYKLPGVVPTLARLSAEGFSLVATRTTTGTATVPEVQEFTVATIATGVTYTVDDGAVVSITSESEDVAPLVAQFQAAPGYSNLPFAVESGVGANGVHIVAKYADSYPLLFALATLDNGVSTVAAVSDDGLCTSRTPKPPIQEVCRSCDACPWVAGEWSECSDTCGVGKQTRSLDCTCPYLDPPYSLSCPSLNAEGVSIVTAMPKEVSCSGYSSCSWTIGPWGDCSSECGNGEQTRLITCPSGNDADCAAREPKATTTQPCTSCSHCSYTIGDWGECDATCGAGIQFRSASCDATCGEAACEQTRTQIIAFNRTCYGYAACYWTSDETWGPCSTLCGTGYQTRGVRCVGVGGSTTENAYCGKLSQPKPAEVQACTTREGCSCAEMQDSMDLCEETSSVDLWNQLTTKIGQCSRECAAGRQSAAQGGLDCNVNFGWHARPWRACSTQCGIGVQYRHVFCPSGNTADCAWQSRPPHQRRCLDTSQCILQRRLQFLTAIDPSYALSMVHPSVHRLPDWLVEGNATLTADEVLEMLTQAQDNDAVDSPAMDLFVRFTMEVALSPPDTEPLFEWGSMQIPAFRKALAPVLDVPVERLQVKSLELGEEASHQSLTLHLEVKADSVFQVPAVRSRVQELKEAVFAQAAVAAIEEEIGGSPSLLQVSEPRMFQAARDMAPAPVDAFGSPLPAETSGGYEV